MMDSRECHDCQKGFCKKCINGYIDTLVAGEFNIVCPSCGSNAFTLVDPHPLLAQQLNELKGACANAEKGCTQIVSYADTEKHQQECDYAIIICTNYGCDAEMTQRDFVMVHETTCEFRVIRCDRCDGIMLNEK